MSKRKQADIELPSIRKEKGTGEVIMRLTQRRLSFCLLAASTILLIGMGLAFGWTTPANSYYHLGGSWFYFSRMLCWTVIGGCLATLAYSVGWRRWLKAAPFVTIGWTGLVFYASTCPLVNGQVEGDVK